MTVLAPTSGDTPRAPASAGGGPSLAVLTPMYNVPPWPEGYLARFRDMCDALAAKGVATILVTVDDGSWRPGTAREAHQRRLSDLPCAKLHARHAINRGQGAAIQTALELACERLPEARWFATLDGDCQHDPLDVPRMMEALRSRQANIVFGTRFAPEVAGRGDMPASRRLVLTLGRLFDRFATGLDLSDAHNGLRVFDRYAAERIALRQDRMAHATELKQIVARERLTYIEVPVVIQYTAESLAHGQGNLNAVNIVRELLEGWWFR